MGTIMNAKRRIKSKPSKQKKPLTGGQAVVKCLEKQGVEYIFGYIGGVAIPIFDALLESKIKLIMSRHEQGATHMADGYARATGKPGVVLVTSGPGAANTVTGITTAYMDSVPIIILTGQANTAVLGKDAFQEADIFGITMPIVKHNYLVKASEDIPRIIKEAFHVSNTGRPGPVLIDLPVNTTAGPCEAPLNPDMDIPGYAASHKINKKELRHFAKMFQGSKKPLLLVGHGVVISRAQNEVKALAEKLNAPVVNTLLGKGGFPETHPLSLAMLGMHGTAYANKALINCDLICSIGSRWDDRINGNNDEFCIGAKKLHIDIDPAEIGKIVQPDASLVGDAKTIVGELVKLVAPLDTENWLKEINFYKEEYPLRYTNDKGLTPQYLIDQLYDITNGKAIIATDVGQNQMWSAQFYKCDYPDRWLSSGGLGTMGYGFPAAIGAQFGRKRNLVVAVVGDGGFQMTMSELATVAINKLPLKILLLDNKYLGMVRQWQDLFFDKRYSGVDLKGNPDFMKIAEAFGIKGVHITQMKDARKKLKQAVDYKGAVLIHAETIKEENVFPMVPAGKSVHHMILEAPRSQQK
jgi:acetolactate synthase-1/2/3 large subunit